MERQFAIIKNDVVLNVIVGGPDQAQKIASQIGATSVETTGLPVQSGCDYIDGEFWLNGVDKSGIFKAGKLLQETDVLTGARGIEDLIGVLITKGTITEDDLPQAFVARLTARKNARAIIT
jgi:hypothetical protein